MNMNSSHPPQNPQDSKKWRYTYEALSHINTLRLFLFHPEIDPSASFYGLSADLRLDRSLLLVRWIQRGGAGDVLLRVPVPRVLVDVGSPVECTARADHIEVKLPLVVPVDHAIAAGFLDALDAECGGRKEGEVDRWMPMCLESDLKSLSGEEVHFYCNTCSMTLTRNSLWDFVELPSPNWREVADNWFGNCCCSFGGASEKMVTKYVDRYACAAGTCLLDLASIIVCKDDLECFLASDDVNGHTGNSVPHFCDSDNRKDMMEEPIACNKEVLCTDQSNTRIENHENTDFSRHGEASLTLLDELQILKIGNNNSLSCRPSCGVICNDDVEPTHPLDLVKISLPDNLKRHADTCFDPDTGTSPCSINLQKQLCEEDCCFTLTSNSSICTNKKSESPICSTTPSVQLPCNVIYRNLSHHGPLANGFLLKPSNLMKGIKWKGFLCRECSSLVGSYPSYCDQDVPVDEGIRLFKCCISTSKSVGGLHDKFRKYTLQKIFTNLLLDSAINELTYRTIVRDLNSGTPILKLVLLNPNIWFATGYCLENDLANPTGVDLRPFAKVLYSECDFAAEDTLRMLEEWSTANHADEVYMLSQQIEKLKHVLRSWHRTLPSSCSSLQGMSISFIDR